MNFLSWHELNDQDITSIAAHINNARRSLQQNPNYQSLKIQKIYVNEISGNLTLKVERIPNSGEQVIKQLVTLRQDNIAVSNEVVRLTIPNLQLHEAYVLTIS